MKNTFGEGKHLIFIQVIQMIARATDIKVSAALSS